MWEIHLARVPGTEFKPTCVLEDTEIFTSELNYFEERSAFSSHSVPAAIRPSGSVVREPSQFSCGINGQSRPRRLSVRCNSIPGLQVARSDWVLQDLSHGRVDSQQVQN